MPDWIGIFTLATINKFIRWRLVNFNFAVGHYFPRYTNGERCNSNSASAAINKWINTVGGSSDVIHGLRHSFRDRLRAIEAPTDMIDQLGGWSLKSVGQGYGDGYDLELLVKYQSKIQLSEAVMYQRTGP